MRTFISIRQMAWLRDISAKFRFGQNKHGRRFGQKNIDISAKKMPGRFGQNIFNSFTESDIICRRIHRINSLPIKLPAISFLGRQEIKHFEHVTMV